VPVPLEESPTLNLTKPPEPLELELVDDASDLGEVLLNAPGEKFRNGTVTDPLPANRFKPFADLELILPKGSAGIVEVDLLRDFGAQGSPRTDSTAERSSLMRSPRAEAG